MSILKFMLLLLLLVGIPFLMAQSAEGAGETNQAQAIQTATDFCQRIGQPAPAKSSASFLTNDPRSPKIPMPTTPVSYVSVPRWHVDFTDKNHRVEVEVNDATGVICYYMISTFGANSSPKPSVQPLTPTTTKDEAISTAKSALEAAGAFKTGELQFKEAFYNQDSAVSAVWYVSWEREFHGLPYSRQDANVGIDALTGEVNGFSVNFRTPPPDSAAFKISREQAQKIAANQLADAGLPSSGVVVEKAEVMQPSNFWHIPFSQHAQEQPIARIAWICSCQVDYRQKYHVWVDAATGDVIGGDYAGKRGKVTLPSKNSKSKSSPTSAKKK